MESILLKNGTAYELVVNGVRDGGDSATYIFQPNLGETFEEIEQNFADSANTDTVYVVGADGDVLKSVIGYTVYTGMEKKTDYVISTETINIGTEEEPQYETTETKGTVMIVHMKKPSLVDKVNELDEIVNMLLINELEG